MAIPYRACRMILHSKKLLGVGRSLSEVVIERVELDVLTARFKLSSEGPLGALASEVPALPTFPTEETTDEERKLIEMTFGYAGLQMGLHPEDPRLFQPIPEAEKLLEFEANLLTNAYKRLLNSGQGSVLVWFNKHLGPLQGVEKRDFAALAYSVLRQNVDIPLDERRQLMVERLERLVKNARKSMDFKLELSALRTLATVQGLTFKAEEDGQRDLLALLGKPPTPYEFTG